MTEAKPRGQFSPPSMDSQPVWGAGLFVWGVWGMMLLLAVSFVLRYGRNVPFWDDFTLVAPLTGDEALTLSWLWERHNEHRISVVKLVDLALLASTGMDFRSGMYFNVAGLGILSFAMIRVMRQVRGHPAYTDAFFPLALLHLGHCENLLFFSTVHFILVTVLPAVFLLLIVRFGNRLTPRAAVLATGCLALLPLCGGPGLAYVPALTLWLGYAGVRCRRSSGEQDKRTGTILLAGVLVSLCLLGAYFVGFQPAPQQRPVPGLSAFLETTSYYLTMSFGPAAGAFFRPFFGFALITLAAGSAALLVPAGVRHPAERGRAVGLLLFLVAVTCPAMAIGWGRAGYGPLAGFALRYVSAASVVACCLYFIWAVHGPPRVRYLAQTCLFTLMAFMFSLNFQLGLNYGKPRQEQLDAFARDVQGGEPLFVLLRRYVPFLHPVPDHLAVYLRLLRDRNVSFFSDLQEGPPLIPVECSIIPESHNIEWRNGEAVGTGRESHLTFTLDQPRFVAGIRIAYLHANPAKTTPAFRVCWKKEDQHDFPDGQCFSSGFVGTGPEEQIATVWVADSIHGFRILPDQGPFVFQIKSITLLMPEPD